MGIFVTMEQLLLDIAAHQLASRRYALIENGSWSPVSGKKMDALLSPLKGWSAIEAPLTVKSALRPDQEAQLERLANAVAADVAKDPAADTGRERREAPLRLQGLRLRLRGRRAAGGLQVPAVRRGRGILPAGGMTGESAHFMQCSRSCV